MKSNKSHIRVEGKFVLGDVVKFTNAAIEQGIGGYTPDRKMVVVGGSWQGECVAVLIKAVSSGRWWRQSYYQGFLEKIGECTEIPKIKSDDPFPEYRRFSH